MPGLLASKPLAASDEATGKGTRSLGRLVTEQSLEKQVLKELNGGIFYSLKKARS